jgi:hypothetical protein
MRDRKLIEDGSVCEGDFMDGIDTYAEWEANKGERTPCRFFPDDCPALRGEGPDCIVQGGHTVARYAKQSGTSVDEELGDFAAQAPIRGEGWFDPTVEEPEDATTDRDEIVGRVGTWAENILGIQSIDSASVNKEFRKEPDQTLAEKYPLLEESIFDPEAGTWIHSCGTTLATAEVRHSVHLKMMPLAGSGRVVTERVPYCPHCGTEPSPYGSPVYEEDLAAEEAAELERIRAVGRRLPGN